MASNDEKKNTEHRNQKQMYAGYRGIEKEFGVETERIIDSRNK